MMQLKDFGTLSAAEMRLIEGAPTGERIVVGSGELPEAAAPEVEVRAALIRMVLLGEDPDIRLHEKGVRLRGAWVTGPLDLQGADSSMDLSLSRCVLDKPARFVNASLRGLFLIGCHCTGLDADHARFSGSVYLRGGFVSQGEVAMPGARITGDLQICDARLENPSGIALFAASMSVGGSLYLGDYPYDEADSTLQADGSILLSSAHIANDLFCRFVSVSSGDGVLMGGKQRDGAEGDNLVALSLVRAEIGGVLFIKDLQVGRGVVNLSGAQTRRLNDEPYGEAARYPVRLDGFDYADFAQHTDISVASRLAWLERRPVGIEFRAQPYEHLARVLQHAGHRDDAHRVLTRKERLQRAANRAIAPAWRRPFMWAFDALLAVMTGYGYRPVLALVWAAGLILVLGMFFQMTWNAGDMAPNAAPILVSADWVAATQSHADNPAEHWSKPGQAGQDYETFNAYAYAADLLVPIVNLGQEAAWAPSTSRSDWGRAGWWIRWFAKAVGWLVTALGAAAITGVIRRD